MIDDLQYWQNILQSAQRSLEIMEATNTGDLRARKAAQLTIKEAESEIENLS